MLSYIFRICVQFESDHGYRPGLLYLGPAHYQRLREELAGIPRLDEVSRLLGMDIIVTAEATHPRVVCSPTERQRVAVAV